MGSKHCFLIFTCYVMFCGYVVVRAASIDCTFDEGFCSWKQAVNNAFNWTLGQGWNTSTNNTGPDSDHTSGANQHIYIRSSNKMAKKGAFRLESLSNNAGNFCLSFWYFIHGRNTDIFRVAVKPVGKQLKKIFRASRNTKQNWILHLKEFYVARPFKIYLDAFIKTDIHNKYGYIAVDHVKMFYNECPKYCDDPTPAFSKTIVRNIWIGSIVNITCIKGYEINGSLAIVCQGNGTWTDRPTCQPVDCGIPSLENGALDQASGNTTFNTTRILSCSRGFTMIGNESVTCMADRKWSSLPSCVITKSTPSALIAIAVTVPLLVIGLFVITIIAVCSRKRKACCTTKTDDEDDHKPDIDQSVHFKNGVSNQCDININSSIADKPLQQDTEYAIITKQSSPEMKEVVYINTLEDDFRNDVQHEYDHTNKLFGPVLDNTYSHIQNNNNYLESYSYSNAAMNETAPQTEIDEYNHTKISRPMESKQTNSVLNEEPDQESNYDHAKAGCCDPYITDLDEYSHLNLATTGH